LTSCNQESRLADFVGLPESGNPAGPGGPAPLNHLVDTTNLIQTTPAALLPAALFLAVAGRANALPPLPRPRRVRHFGTKPSVCSSLLSPGCVSCRSQPSVCSSLLSPGCVSCRSQPSVCSSLLSPGCVRFVSCRLPAPRCLLLGSSVCRADWSPAWRCIMDIGSSPELLAAGLVLFRSRALCEPPFSC
jgi:hypothetical protein